jgi:hypothetical protein
LVVGVKTTLVIPEPLFRRAKAIAAQRGQSLRQFVAEAMQEKLEGSSSEGAPQWMRFFGALKGKSGELSKIDRLIEKEFENDPRLLQVISGTQELACR